MYRFQKHHLHPHASMQNYRIFKFSTYQFILHHGFPNLHLHEWCVRMYNNFSLLLPGVGNMCLFPPSFLMNIARELPMLQIFSKNKFVSLMTLFYIFFLIHWVLSFYYFISSSVLPFNSYFFFLVLWDRIRSVLFIFFSFLMFGRGGIPFSLGTALAALQKFCYIVSLLFSSKHLYYLLWFFSLNDTLF